MLNDKKLAAHFLFFLQLHYLYQKHNKNLIIR